MPLDRLPAVLEDHVQQFRIATDLSGVQELFQPPTPPDHPEAIAGHSQTSVVPYLQPGFDVEVKRLLEDPEWRARLRSADPLKVRKA